MIVSGKPRILCVDNSRDDCDLLQFILGEHGYHVEVAQTLSEGLGAIEQNHFALYIFDLSFPDGTGFVLVDQVRQATATIPIIVCSGDVRDSTREEVIRSGANLFFAKPLDLDTLMQQIAQLMIR